MENSVLFITRYPLDCSFNLKSKFDGQMSAFKELGYKVYYWGYDSKHFYLVHNDNRIPVKKLFFVKTAFFHHFLSYISLYISVIKSINSLSLGEGDVSYIRSMPSEFFHKIMLSKLRKKGVKNIIEIPTYIKSGGEKPRFFIRLFKAVLKPFSKNTNIHYFSIIGDDCNGQFRGLPAVNINNCISLDGFPIRKPIQHKGFNMLAVASMSNWHGYDRVIKGMSNYKGSDVHLYMVGGDGDGSLAKWKKLANSLGLEYNVHFVGPKHGPELTDIYNKCDLAFASLGMYRTNCFNASVLKAREYSARGIPFVYATNDPVLDNYPMPFFYKIANNDSPVDIRIIREFFNDIHSINGIPQQMREYAKERMSWAAEIKKVISLIC